MEEQPNYISVPQLKDIAASIAASIAAASDLPALTMDELNAEEFKSKKCMCLRKVTNNTGSSVYGYVLTLNMLVCYAQVYIGMTDSEGDTDALTGASVNSYGKQPGLSIAIRYNVTVNLFDKDIVSAVGATPWHVTPIAYYSGLLQVTESSKQIWIGSEENYDALTERAPKTLYCII